MAYVTPEEQRARNLAAIHRVPEGIRLGPLPVSQPEPKESPMSIVAAPESLRPPIKWPLFVILALAAALVGVLFAFQGCKTITGNPTVQDSGHIVADCAAAEVHDIALHAIDDVTTAIAETDYNGAIRDVAGRLITQLTGTLGARAAEDAWAGIKCVVAEIQQKTNVQLGYGKMAYGDAVRLQTMNQHASAWLAAH